MDSIRNFKYKLIKNFLTPEEVELGRHYFLLKHKKNETEFEKPVNNNCDSKFYADNFSETILIKKIPLVEKESGLQLYPTYSFSRVYTYNSDLKKHKDRPSCEISVTTMWGSDGIDWPIYMQGNPVVMKPGDAVIYLGCELQHWREPFTGDYHIQSFIHYVDKNGPHTNWRNDGRNWKDNPEIEWKKE
jgi:hypothetical protein